MVRLQVGTRPGFGGDASACHPSSDAEPDARLEAMVRLALRQRVAGQAPSPSAWRDVERAIATPDRPRTFRLLPRVATLVATAVLALTVRGFGLAQLDGTELDPFALRARLTGVPVLETTHRAPAEAPSARVDARDPEPLQTGVLPSVYPVELPGAGSERPMAALP
jgi:hypothetical protein